MRNLYELSVFVIIMVWHVVYSGRRRISQDTFGEHSGLDVGNAIDNYYFILPKDFFCPPLSIR